MRATRRLGLALVGGLLVVVGVLASAPAGPAVAAPPAPPACDASARAAGNTVALVIVFPGGDRRTACVAAGGSGIDVLRRGGFAPVVSAYGSVGGTAAVCAVTHPATREQIGCADGPSCLTCAAPDYWTYFPGYRYAQSGAGTGSPAAGSVEAWQWGRTRDWSGSRPGATTICSPEPPPSTTPPSTSPRPTTPGPTPPGGGTIDPGPPGASVPPGGAGGPDAPPDGSTTTSTAPPADGSPTTTADPGAPTTVPSDAATASGPEDSGPGSGSGDGAVVEEERADGPLRSDPAGDGGGGGGVVVPVATTGGLVAVLAAFALRARRRRPSDHEPRA